MDPQVTLVWVIVCTTVAVVCLIAQIILLFVMTRASLAMKRQTDQLVARVEPVAAKVEPLLETGLQLLTELRGYAADVSTKSNEILDLGRQQLMRVDDVLGEAATRTRAQMDRIEMVMDDTVNRFQETTTLFQNSVVRPLKQINAVTAGIRAALTFLASGRRATVEQATHDEEMFI